MGLFSAFLPCISLTFFFSLDMFKYENLLRWKIFTNRRLEKQPQERLTEFSCDFACLDLQECCPREWGMVVWSSLLSGTYFVPVGKRYFIYVVSGFWIFLF